MSTQDLTLANQPLPDRLTYAKALAASGLLPKAFVGQPANVLVAIEYGNALGLAPMVALNEINVINGTPSLSAMMMAALAREAGHKVRIKGDSKSASCTIIRADDPDFEHTATWDRAKAEASGLWGKNHWQKDPATMLKWRAISEAVRFACPEVLGGLKYTPEEVRDFTPSQQHIERHSEANIEDAEVVDAELEQEQPTPEQILESTDLDQLRAWWMAGDAEMRELIDTRVLVLKETEGQVSES